jgi:membrane protein
LLLNLPAGGDIIMLRTFYDAVKETASEWVADKAPSRGAALAYYSMFAIAPIVIFTVSLAGVVYGQQAATGQVAQQISGTVGPEVADAIESLVKSASNPKASAVATLIGLAIGLFGAAGTFGELQDALNTIWKVMPRPGRPILQAVRDRAFSFAMVLACGILLLASVVVTATLSAVAAWVTPEWLPGGVELWQGVNTLVSFAFVALLFALIFKVVPDARLGWGDVWAGAVLTALLFTAGKYLLAIYLTRAGVASAYGAAGSLAVVLVWVYYSAQILLFGAEFTRMVARRRGSECGPKPSAEPMTAEALARRGITRVATEGAAARR